jgi:1-acyl-sn-glycerol-3-phosphate acyltransferase
MLLLLHCCMPEPAWRHCTAVWCTLCLALPERVNGVRVRVTGEVRCSRHRAGRPARAAGMTPRPARLPPPRPLALQLPARDSTLLLISNHKCDLDYVFVWAVAARLGALQPGYFCAVAKGALRRVPLFGWLFKSVCFLFLARSWEADRHRMGVWAATAVARVRPMWLLLYPEGTRFTARAKERSDEAAAKDKVPPLECELLLPRTKGFCTLAVALAPRFQTVMDMTIAYVGTDGKLMGWGQLGTSAITALAAGRLPLARVDVHLELFPFASLPKGENPEKTEKALAAWLNARWRAKEALLRHAQAHGAFPAAPKPLGGAPADARVPAARTLACCAVYAAGIAVMFHLLRVSAHFRMYMLLSSVGLALFANADPPDW